MWSDSRPREYQARNTFRPRRVTGHQPRKAPSLRSKGRRPQTARWSTRSTSAAARTHSTGVIRFTRTSTGVSSTNKPECAHRRLLLRRVRPSNAGDALCTKWVIALIAPYVQHGLVTRQGHPSIEAVAGRENVAAAGHAMPEGIASGFSALLAGSRTEQAAVDIADEALLWGRRSGKSAPAAVHGINTYERLGRANNNPSPGWAST